MSRFKAGVAGAGMLAVSWGVCVHMRAQSPAPAALLDRYRAVLRPALDQSATVENVNFIWTGLRFTLERGQLALAAPVEGRRMAAVFEGSGILRVSPADDRERQQIALRHPGAAELVEPFSHAVFRFADGDVFQQALADQLHFKPFDGSGSPLTALLASRAHALVAHGQPDGVRMLAALAAPLHSPVAGPLLMAELETRDAGWLSAEVDGLEQDPVRVHTWVVRPYSDSSQVSTSLLRWEYNEPSTELGGLAPGANVSALDPDPVGTAANTLNAGDAFSGVSSITDDPTAAKAEHPSTANDHPLTGFDDVWTAFQPSNLRGAQPWQVNDYQVAVNIGGAYDLAGNLNVDVKARLALTPLQSVGRGLLLRFNPQFRVNAVTGAGGEALEFLQPPNPGDPAAPDYSGHWLYVELASAAAPGASTAITVTYRGKLLESLGAGNYLFHGEDWLPSSPYGAPLQAAGYDLRFTNDKSLTVVASGERISNQRQGDAQLSEWKSSGPITSAGFAVGDFQEVTAAADAVPPPLQLRAFVNKRADMAFSQIASSVFAAQNAAPTNSPAGLKRIPTGMNANSNPPGAAGMQPTKEIAPALLALGNLTPAAAAPGVLGETSNELRFLISLFGPFPFPSLAINNLPSRIVTAPQRETPTWPQLVCLSNATFLDSLQQHVLGLDGTEQQTLEYLAGAHALAHQWWNGAVTPASTHDQWMSDGMASAATLLYEESRLGEAAAQDTLRQWRTALSQTDIFGHVPEQLGALTLGPRLRSPQDPLGYEVVANDKGGYVFYMLREMMRDPRSNGDADAAFLAMLHEIAAAFAHGGVSTADVQAAAERHMTPGMDLDNDGSLNWFFDQYVRSTGVPRLGFHSTVTSVAGGKSVVAISVQNPGHWHGLLPVYLSSSPQQWVRVQVRIDADQVAVQLPVGFVPVAVEPNRFQDMLVVVNP